MKKILSLFCAILLPISLATPLHGAPDDTLLTTLLRFAGISATPSRQKGGSDMRTGEIWVVDVARRTQSRVTSEEGYRTPVFMPGDQYILALKGDNIVQTPVQGGEATKLYPIERAVKLVGSNKENHDQVLLLREEKDGTSSLGVLSLKNGKVSSILFNRQSVGDLDMIGHIKGWERVYGDTRVYVQGETKRTPSGRVGYTDVYLQQGDRPPENVSQCNGAICGQPSLSHNGRLVAFIKSER